MALAPYRSPEVRGKSGATVLPFVDRRERLECRWLTPVAPAGREGVSVAHRFKVKGFSSIWNALTQGRIGSTPAGSRYRRPASGWGAGSLLALGVEESGELRHGSRDDVEMLFSMRCLLLGHDDWMVRSPERLRLRCDHCRRETPGWTLTRLEASRAPVQVTTPSGHCKLSSVRA